MARLGSAAKAMSSALEQPQILWDARRVERDRAAMDGKSVSIVTGDCWGAAWYQQMARDYTTPFVAIRVMAACYARLVKDVEGYLAQPLEFVDRSSYAAHPEAGRAFPLARLGDIELQFVHYSSRVEAAEKWQRRLGRLDPKNLRFKLDLHKDGLTEDILADIVDAQPDVLLLGNRHSAAHLRISDYTEDGAHMLPCSSKQFDLTPWLVSGDPRTVVRRSNPLQALSSAPRLARRLRNARHSPGAANGRDALNRVT